MANFKSYQYNSFDWYDRAGSFTWTKPSDIDEDKPILVHVWGAGGSGDYYISPGSSTITATQAMCRGGGGGGLAVKLIDVSSLGATETITVGDRAAVDAQAGTSSFGAHCSATGGNSGFCATENQGSGTVADDNYGIGGLGVGGDVNKRGGRGGLGFFSTNAISAGGGGGSAPAPYGVSDGFDGGAATNLEYGAGGGGGIGAAGGVGNRIGGAGGSSMSHSPVKTERAGTPDYNAFTPMTGMPGLFGAGGASGTHHMQYHAHGGDCGKNGELPYSDDNSTFVIDANALYFGGGSGASGFVGSVATHDMYLHAHGGGPGAGGGGQGGENLAPNMNGGDGGLLAGGGGANYRALGGFGGNGGGGGGCNAYLNEPDPNNGGFGLVVVQYFRKFS